MLRDTAPLWICGQCGRAFANRNQSHACGRWTLDRHFAGKPAVVREIYDRFLVMLEGFGPVTLDPLGFRSGSLNATLDNRYR